MIRLLLLLVGFGISYECLHLTAQCVYDDLLPGVPDCGRFPIASLPWLLAEANTPGRPWNDSEHFWVWMVAVMEVWIPVCLILGYRRNRKELLLGLGVTICLLGMNIRTLYALQMGYIEIFGYPRTRSAQIDYILAPIWWTIGLTAGAVIFSYGWRRLRRFRAGLSLKEERTCRL